MPMKKIIDYITENNFDAFDLLILPHITIAYHEHNVHNRFRIISEKYGVYDGLNELISHIHNDIKDKYNKKDNKYGFQLNYTKDDLKDFKNIFFSNLHIDIEIQDAKCGGDYTDNDSINKDTMLFDDVYIDLYINDIYDAAEMIKHELTHAYNNYNLLLKNNDKQFKLATSDFYNKITTIDFNIDQFKEYVNKVLYFTIGEEQNAFIAQLSDELRKNKDKISTPVDALNILKKSVIYNTYKSLYQYIQDYKNNKLSQDIIDIITKQYNYVCKSDLTSNKVFKKLDFLINKSIKKFDIIIGKLCLENLNNKITLAPTNLYIND